MNRIILILLLYLPIILTAQNWRNICSPGKTFYIADSGKLAAFRLDSIAVRGLGDTIYYSYRTMRGPEGGECLDSLHGSLLGNKVIGKSDGRFCFFNSMNDSLWINTQSKLNDSWIFYHPTGGSFITAQIISIIIDTVLGLPDSVKLISLTGSKPGVNTIIRLSKHYGLSQMIDVYDIPTISCFYTLVGKSSPALGYQQCMRGQDIYNFSVGDEFHYYHRNDIAYPRHFDTTEIRKALAVAWASDSGSVTYTFSRCMHIQHIWEYPVDTTYTDTVNWQYSFSPGLDSTMLMKMPEEKDWIWLHQFFYRKYNGRTTSYSRWGEYWFYPESGCWESGTSGGPLVKANYFYTPGLGLTGYSSELHGFNESLSLKYYRKGDETWGTPVTVECSNTGVADNLKTLQAMVIPNPVIDRFSLSIEGIGGNPPYHYNLKELLGGSVLTGSFYGRSCCIDRNGLPAGLYVLLVRDSKERSFPSIKVLFK